MPAASPRRLASVPVSALVNGGFESRLDGLDASTASVTTTTSGTHSGTSALWLSGGSAGAEQEVMNQLQVGASYKLTAFAKLGKKGETAAVDEVLQRRGHGAGRALRAW